MAFFDTHWYCNFGDGSTTGYYAVAKRPQNAAVAVGQIVRQFTTPASGSERVFVCTVAGTTANTTDATWSTSRGAETTDGTAKWRECTGAAAVNGDSVNVITWATLKAAGLPSTGLIIKRNNGVSYQYCTQGSTLSASEPAFSDTPGTVTNDAVSIWVCIGLVSSFTAGGAAPHARLSNVFGTNWFAPGNTVYVGDNHVETMSGNLSLSVSSAAVARILCHNHSGSYPPGSSDGATGASVTCTGAGNSVSISAQGSFYFYGIALYANSGGVSIGAGSVGQVQNWYCFDNCILSSALNSTSAMVLGASGTAWAIVVLNNTTVKFSGTSACIATYFSQLLWQNTGQVLAAGSSIPTTLFQQPSSSGRFSNVILRNLDLSQLTGSLFTNASNSSIGSLTVQDCKLNAAMTVTRPINSGMNVQLIRSDSAATAYKSQRIAYEGTETTETSIVRTGGAVDPNSQAQSRKIVTSANAQWLRPFKCEPMAIYNSTVGSAVTATVCGTVNAGALPQNDDIWTEFEYLGSATDPLGTIVTTTKSSVLASNAAVASDSSTWGTPHTTFDGTPSAGIVMSNGNLTVTHGTTNNATGVTSTAFLSGGKYYFEIAAAPWSSTSAHAIGIILSITTFANLSAGSVRVVPGPANTFIFVDNTNTGKNLGATAVNDVFGFAINFTNMLVWVRRNSGSWNADGTANPVTGIGGVTIASVGIYAPFVVFNNIGATDAFTANFGQSAFANAAPSGFLSWDTGWTPFKLATTITPQLPGYIHARVRVGKASATYYVDPKCTLS